MSLSFGTSSLSSNTLLSGVEEEFGGIRFREDGGLWSEVCARGGLAIDSNGWFPGDNRGYFGWSGGEDEFGGTHSEEDNGVGFEGSNREVMAIDARGGMAVDTRGGLPGDSRGELDWSGGENSVLTFYEKVVE